MKLNPIVHHTVVTAIPIMASVGLASTGVGSATPSRRSRPALHHRAALPLYLWTVGLAGH
jgi:hypothetical protein